MRVGKENSILSQGTGQAGSWQAGQQAQAAGRQTDRQTDRLKFSAGYTI